jgi:hypothetical protein
MQNMRWSSAILFIDSKSQEESKFIIQNWKEKLK